MFTFQFEQRDSWYLFCKLALILAFLDTYRGLSVFGTKTLSQLSVEILILPPKTKDKHIR